MSIGENTRNIILKQLAKLDNILEIDYCLELWVQTHGFKAIHFIGLTSQIAFNRRAFFIHSQDENFIDQLTEKLQNETIVNLRQSIILNKYSAVRDMFFAYGMHAFPVHGVRQSVGVFLLEPALIKPLSPQDKIFISQELSLFTTALFKAYLPQFTQDIALTPREAEVLSWVAQGKSNTVIAEIMEVSPHTVDNYLRRTYSKIGVNNRTSAAVKALLLGLTAI